jgi:hypothetical protein
LTRLSRVFQRLYYCNRAEKWDTDLLSGPPAEDTRVPGMGMNKSDEKR